MKCLRCENSELEVQAKGTGGEVFEIDLCPTCAGIWLDAKELAKLDDNFFVDVEKIQYEGSAATPQDQALECPRCNVSLNKVHPKGHGSVILDTCDKCNGFWLDKGELEKMRAVSDKMLIDSLLDLD